MELRNEFRVAVPLETAWAVLNDVERIAPCLPGAQLQEIEGNEYRGIVKVKVGPITAQYKGKATIAEQDEAAGRIVLTASGRDTGGGGNANATITTTMVADGRDTKVSVVTDLAITGKLAQFGRGVLSEVSAKLLGQFVAALEHTLLAPAPEPPARAAEATSPQPVAPEPAAPDPTAPAPVAAIPGSGAPAAEPSAPAAPAPDPAAPAAEASVGESSPQLDTPPEGPPSPAPASDNGAAATAPASTAPAPAAPTVRRIEGPEVEPVDLVEAARRSLAKRILLPLAALVALVAGVVLWRRRSPS